MRPQAEIEVIIKEASEAFQGTAYNLLSKNCNHFTQYLCEKLTGTPGPAWLNRAASIGVALPCVVPVVHSLVLSSPVSLEDRSLLRSSHNLEGQSLVLLRLVLAFELLAPVSRVSFVVVTMLT